MEPHELQVRCWSSATYFRELVDQAETGFRLIPRELPVFPAFCARRFVKSRGRRAARDRAVHPRRPAAQAFPDGTSSFRSPPSGLPQRRDGRIVRAAHYARSATGFSQERRRQTIQAPAPITAPKTKSEVQKTAVLVVVIVRSQM